MKHTKDTKKKNKIKKNSFFFFRIIRVFRKQNSFRFLWQFTFVLKREFDERVRSLQVEFGTDMSAMVVNRSRADAEFGGDVFTRFEFG